MVAIILLVILASAFALQIVTGGFPVEFFEFPLNVVILILWLIGVLWLWSSRRKSLLVSFLLSPSATFSSVLMLIAACLYMGFTGSRSFSSSWIFVLLIIYLQTVLLFVILRGWREATPTGARLGPVRVRFLLLHLGMLIAMTSAFWGSPDSRTLRMKVTEGISTNEAYAMDGAPEFLDYEVELKDFNLQTYDNDMPSDFSAVIAAAGKTTTLRVNHPFRVGFGEQIYLSSYDAEAGPESDYCILQIVQEPWKGMTLAGMVMMLAGALLLFIAGPRKRYNDID
jgi:hypothetical protein